MKNKVRCPFFKSNNNGGSWSSLPSRGARVVQAMAQGTPGPLLLLSLQDANAAFCLLVVLCLPHPHQERGHQVLAWLL